MVGYIVELCLKIELFNICSFFNCFDKFWSQGMVNKVRGKEQEFEGCKEIQQIVFVVCWMVSKMRLEWVFVGFMLYFLLFIEYFRMFLRLFKEYSCIGYVF